MNILYATQYFPPEVCAPAARVSELARHWTRAGHRVTVLTGFPNHPTGVVPKEYRAKLRRLVCREKFAGADVVRTWLMPLPNRKAYERILNYASFCLSSSLTGSFLARPDAIIATSPQLMVGLTGWWLSRLKRVPFILEVRDLWPESLVAVGVGGESSLLYRSLSALAGFLYRSADHIVVVTEAFKKELVEKWNVDPEKISVIENGVETDFFTPEADADEARELGLEGKFVVSYIGTMGNAHGLDTVLEAAAELQQTLPDVVLMFVGEGAERERLVETARRMHLSNVRFLPLQPRAKIPAIIRASDLCLVLLRRAEVFKTVIPTKMLEFMSCARPVLVGVDGEARRLVVDEAEAGVFVQPEDTAALVRAVTELYHDPARRESLGRNGRRHIVERLSRAETAKAYVGLLEKIVPQEIDRRVPQRSEARTTTAKETLS